MSKWLYIALVLTCFSFTARTQETKKEDPKVKTWEKEKENLRYRRDKDYKGPKDWGSSRPTDIREESYTSQEELDRRLYGSSNSSGGSSRRFGGSSRGGTIQYQPQKVQRQRQKNYQGFDRGGGEGTVKYDPTIKRPEPAQAPERRESRTRNRRSSSTQSSSSSSSSSSFRTTSGFWKVLLIILVVAAVVILLYYLLRNKKPVDSKVLVDVEDEWNPEVVTKTELELKLEAASEREDYRECVRIYFTFILKELIKKGWIRWKKEKTNHHYVMEIGGREGSMKFMECVRIYDLVWYGEYEIDREIYDMLQPTLLNYYKSLDPTDD